MLELKALDTLAFGGLALLLGYGIRRMVPVIDRYNIPPPVIGGLLVAVVALIAHSRDVTLFKFDTSLQSPMMIAFFTTVGFGASLSLLRTGGVQVALFLGVASVFAVLQNVIGALLASAFGLHPLFGVLSGSVTLAGGPATGLAFAPLFEQAGVPGAASVAVAAAMAGIVAGALFGGPVGTFLIERHRLRTQAAAEDGEALSSSHGRRSPTRDADFAFTVPEASTRGNSHRNAKSASRACARRPSGASDDPEQEILERFTRPEEVDAYAVLRNLVFLLVAMWLGSWVSAWFASLGVTLPAYIGAMIVAAVIRNVDDATGWFRISHRLMDTLGAVALSLFLALALMTLKLWELSGLALPLVVNVVAQLVMVMAVCVWPVFQLMGRDYDSAVMSGGFVGFMLGTTANAMAVMRTLVERYGAAPRAFLVAPLVGAFFIDFTNALIITGFLNFLG